MEIREVACDRKGCTRRNAKRLSIFSHRAQDGAGSSETWEHLFDLCEDHGMKLLQASLKKLGPEIAKELVDSFDITTRLG